MSLAGILSASSILCSLPTGGVGQARSLQFSLAMLEAFWWQCDETLLGAKVALSS